MDNRYKVFLATVMFGLVFASNIKQASAEENYEMVTGADGCVRTTDPKLKFLKKDGDTCVYYNIAVPSVNKEGRVMVLTYVKPNEDIYMQAFGTVCGSDILASGDKMFVLDKSVNDWSKVKTPQLFGDKSADTYKEVKVKAGSEDYKLYDFMCKSNGTTVNVK